MNCAMIMSTSLKFGFHHISSIRCFLIIKKLKFSAVKKKNRSLKSILPQTIYFNSYDLRYTNKPSNIYILFYYFDCENSKHDNFFDFCFRFKCPYHFYFFSSETKIESSRPKTKMKQRNLAWRT